MTVIIVEDDPSTADFIEMILEKEGYRIVSKCNSFESGLKAVNTLDPDVVLLDIDLGDGPSGIDLAREIGGSSTVIFLTSYFDMETIKQAKHAGLSSYLTKPFKPEDLVIAMELAKDDQEQVEVEEAISVMEDSIFVRDRGLFVRLRFDDIYWLKAEGAYTELKLTGKKYVIRNLLKDVEARFPGDRFFRVHRSYVINIEAITAINHQSVYFDDLSIPISRNSYKQILAKIKLISSSDKD